MPCVASISIEFCIFFATKLAIFREFLNGRQDKNPQILPSQLRDRSMARVFKSLDFQGSEFRTSGLGLRVLDGLGFSEACIIDVL